MDSKLQQSDQMRRDLNIYNPDEVLRYLQSLHDTVLNIIPVEYTGSLIDKVTQLVLDATMPIDMILPCPNCGMNHVDAPEPESDWTNPPHKSHLCHGCGFVWRPCDRTTNGVAQILTKGRDDSPVTTKERKLDEATEAPNS
jgi:hypothetical protein